MNKNDKLQNSLKKAFEEHHEPLYEAQWERLNAALDEKPRRRFIPWFYAIGVIGMICLAFMMGYYFNSGNKQSPVAIAAEKTPLTENPNSGNATAINPSQKTDTLTKTPANTLASNTNTANSNDNIQSETDKKPNTSMANSTSPIQKSTQSSTTKTNSQPVAKPANADIATTPNTEKTQNETTGTTAQPLDNISGKTTEKNKDQEPVKNTNSIADKGNTNDGKAEPKDSTLKNTIAANSSNKANPKDSIKKDNGKKKKDNETLRKKFAFTLASGISTDKGEISKFDKPANMHKDSRMVFEQSNKNNQSVFVNLGFEWHPSTRLSLIFNSGLQYREFTSYEDINYKYNEVPFHWNGSIQFYIHVDDTNNPMIFVNKSTLKTKYVNIPLRFGYTFSLHPRHELMPSLGANISKIVGVEGNTFSLNDAEIKPLKDITSKKINIGLIAGMQYSYNIYKPLWLGLEMQWQQNVYHYNTRYGSMSGKFNTYNYNMILKYKF